MSNSRHISIVIPIYNEEAILASSVRALLEQLSKIGIYSDYEIVLCENGSTDNTLAIARQLERECDAIRVERLDTPSYGRALRHGILAAHGRVIFIFNADFWDVGFLESALILSKEFDLIIGSKQARGAIDRRPFARQFISRSFNLILKLFFGYEGTDTHGLKALNAARVVPLVSACRTTNDLFDSELILRAQRAGLRLHEIPVEIAEQRSARVGLFRRVPGTVKDLLKMWWALRS